jgi:hypothetical protein
MPIYTGLDDEWLERRFDMFERFCIPAVAAQKVRFDWLVFFDDETPGHLRDRLDPFVQSNLLEPIYVEGPLFDRVIAAEVLTRLRSDTQILITTRVDSDDGIRSDYLWRIQRTALRAQDGFLNFPLGVQWWGGRCYLCLDASNAFISRVETRSPDSTWEPQTVFCDIGHDRLIRDARVRQVLSPPAWLVTIHDTNMESVQRGIRWPLRRPPQAVALGSPDEFVLDPLPARIRDVALTSRQSLADVFSKRWALEERTRVMLRSWRGDL